jgi:hypothetical protein
VPGGSIAAHISWLSPAPKVELHPCEQSTCYLTETPMADAPSVGFRSNYPQPGSCSKNGSLPNWPQSDRNRRSGRAASALEDQPTILVEVLLKLYVTPYRLQQMPFLIKQRSHSATNFVSYRADYIHWLPLRVRERPITSTKSGNIRALVAAAHRNEKLGVSRQFLCQPLGLCAGKIDSDFLHRSLHFRVNSRTRLCPS